jgi:hypothetical protein
MSMIKFFKKEAIEEKNLNKVYDNDTSGILVGFENEASKVVWSKSLG